MVVVEMLDWRYGTYTVQALARGGYAVVVDLDYNRLYFAKGRRVLWSAPVGTGTGMRLEHGNGEWDFATPNGTFHVTYKEIEPDWIAPDWYFVEKGLRVPPRNSDARRFPRGLGSAGGRHTKVVCRLDRRPMCATGPGRQG